MDDAWQMLEEWNNYNENIDKLISDLHLVTDAVVEDDDFGTEELSVIQVQMKNLIEQGEFWIEHNNPKRFIYDLKKHLIWMCDYMEKVIESNYGKQQDQNKQDEF